MRQGVVYNHLRRHLFTHQNNRSVVCLEGRNGDEKDTDDISGGENTAMMVMVVVTVLEAQVKKITFSRNLSLSSSY